MAVCSTPKSSPASSTRSFDDSDSLFSPPPTRRSTGLTSILGDDSLADVAIHSDQLQTGPNTLDDPFAIVLVPRPVAGPATEDVTARKLGNGLAVDPAFLAVGRRLMPSRDGEASEASGAELSKTSIFKTMKQTFISKSKPTRREQQRLFFPHNAKPLTKAQGPYGRHLYRYGSLYTFTVLENLHADSGRFYSTYLALQAQRGQRDTRLRVVIRLYDAVVPGKQGDSGKLVHTSGLSAARRERRVFGRLGSIHHTSKQYLLDAFGCLRSGGCLVFVTPAQHCDLHQLLSGNVQLPKGTTSRFLSRSWIAQLVCLFHREEISLHNPDPISFKIIGLHTLHQLGIIHRDFRPKNIMLTHQGQLKIGDYSNAFVHNEFAPLTPGGRFCYRPRGTHDYGAPEMEWQRERGGLDDSEVMDADETNPRGRYAGYGQEVDIWALGCVAAELLRDIDEPHKVLFEKVERRNRYLGGDRDTQFEILERFLKTNNHFCVVFVHSLLHVNPHKRLSLDAASTHRFFDLWLKDARFPNGKRVKNLVNLATYEPFTIDGLQHPVRYDLDADPLPGRQAYITAWAEKPIHDGVPRLDSLENYTWVNPEEPRN